MCKGFVAEDEICMQWGRCNSDFYENGHRYKAGDLSVLTVITCCSLTQFCKMKSCILAVKSYRELRVLTVYELCQCSYNH